MEKFNNVLRGVGLFFYIGIYANLYALFINLATLVGLGLASKWEDKPFWAVMAFVLLISCAKSIYKYLNVFVLMPLYMLIKSKGLWICAMVFYLLLFLPILANYWVKFAAHDCASIHQTVIAICMGVYLTLVIAWRIFVEFTTINATKEMIEPIDVDEE